jgi:hypothetical protein
MAVTRTTCLRSCMKRIIKEVAMSTSVNSWESQPADVDRCCPGGRRTDGPTDSPLALVWNRRLSKHPIADVNVTLQKRIATLGNTGLIASRTF